MKYLFVVQGEGRGHMTQAITLENLLIERGHEVVGILVGKSPSRQLPDFFVNSVKAPIHQYESINFQPSSSGRKPSKMKTAFASLILHRYLPSIRFIKKTIKSSGADVVVNFYEPLLGITYLIHRIRVPQIAIGHQYLFLHEAFGMPYSHFPEAVGLNYFSKRSCHGAVKKLALSFCDMPVDKNHKIKVVPPLLRPALRDLKPYDGNYILGYMLNAGFSKDVMEWHEKHPETSLRFFWDNWSAGQVKVVDDTLSFHLIDDREFLRQMEGCHAYSSTAGFESVCEAMYLGKPILMVPSHIEQEINAFDASRNGAGISASEFDISRLLAFAKTYRPVESFRAWADSASERFIFELEHPSEL